MEKEIIILTKSDKNGGYCVAGIDRKSGKFIRLVSQDSKSEHALFDNDLLYDDEENSVEIMDIVKVKLKGKQECWYQPENYVIDNNYYFEKIGTSNVTEIRRYLTNQDYIFYNQLNSIESKELAKELEKYSLIALKVEELALWLDKFKQGRITASFTFNHELYRFIKITDPVLTEKYYKYIEQSFPRPYVVNDAILIMSLAGAHIDGKHYKLVANIIEDRSNQICSKNLF